MEGILNLLPLAFVAVIFTFGLLVFSLLHSFFMSMKRLDEALWVQLGRPHCKISFPLDNKNNSIPPQAIFSLYKWLIVTPDWVKGDVVANRKLLHLRGLFAVQVLIAITALVWILKYGLPVST